jgi:hypothetical protein
MDQLYIMLFAPPINRSKIYCKTTASDPQSKIACFPVKLPWFSCAPFAAY